MNLNQSLIFESSNGLAHLDDWGQKPIMKSGDTRMRGEEDSLHLASKVFREATKRWGKQRYNRFTLRETNISHLGKRKKSSSNMPYHGDMLVPWRVDVLALRDTRRHQIKLIPFLHFVRLFFKIKISSFNDTLEDMKTMDKPLFHMKNLDDYPRVFHLI